MSNPYYTHGSFPTTGSPATSASMRAELQLIADGFDKLPSLTSVANQLVVVNSGSTALTTTTTLPSVTVNDSDFVFQDNADATRKFRFEATSVAPGATRVLTVPDANLTLVGADTTQTLTNKTISGSSNTLTNIANASLTNSAVTIGSTSVSLGGTAATVAGLTLTGAAVNGTVGATTPSTGAFTTVSASGAVTLSAGTANGVAYLNGSKVLTTGSALTFDGTRLGISTASPNGSIDVNNGAYVLSNSGAYIGGIGRAAGILGVGSLSDIAITTSGATNLIFGVNTSEQMRLTSTGLGIGTSSIPSVGSTTVLAVGNSSGGTLGVVQSGSIVYRISASTSGVDCYNPNSSPISWYTAGTSRLTLDSSGNLGLGVTPSAWATYKGIQVGTAGSAAFWGGAGLASVSLNTFFNGAYTYQANGFACDYYQNAGSHVWRTAPSGTAGNAISFTQAMTLDASGNLLVGGTTSYGRVSVVGGDGVTLAIKNTVATTTGTEYSQLVFNGTGNSNQNFELAKLRVISTNGGANAGVLAFDTSGTERARIDSSGNLLVGTTSGNGYRLQTDGQYSFLAKSTGTATGSYASIWHTATTGDNIFLYFSTETGGSTRGSITYNRGAGLTAYNTTSDYRAKDIIGPVEDSGSVIDSVPVYTGKMKGATQERPMFIAHETPAYAHTGEKDAVDADGNPLFQQMDASALVPVLWAELQSLRKRVAQLEAASDGTSSAGAAA